MNALPSIQRRLLGAMLVIGLSWGLATTLAVGLVVRHEVDEVLDQGLKEAGEIILGVLQYNAAAWPAGGSGTLPAPAHDEQLVWQLVGPRGDVELRSHRAPERAISGLRARGFSRSTEWRAFATPFDADGRMLYVAQTGSERHEARLEAVLFVIGTALLVGGAAAIWLRARTRRELAPIDALAQAVRGHDPAAPRSVLPAPTREELRPMHAAITDLGGRLAKRIANEQAFAAHAAHALRTPLATVITNLAVAQRRATDEEDRKFLQRSREAANRLRRVVLALLTMFRAGGEPRLQQVDVATLVAQLPFEPLAVTTEAQTTVMADQDLLAAALMNLLDNAQRHGASMVGLQVLALPEQGRVDIVMRDDGRGMSPAQLYRLQFAMDTEDYEGHTGLGLMLADRVARAHGGRCELRPSPRGCTVVLSLESGGVIGPLRQFTATSRPPGPQPTA